MRMKTQSIFKEKGIETFIWLFWEKKHVVEQVIKNSVSTLNKMKTIYLPIIHLFGESAKTN